MRRLQHTFVTLLTSATLLSLTGCGFSQWHTHSDNADKALQGQAPDRLAVAEKELKIAVEMAWKDRVPEKEIVGVYAKLGDIMMEQKKYADAPLYLIRTLQFNNEMKTDPDTNIAQLRKLVTAYEKSRDYEQAAQTQHILVKFIEFERSPRDPDYQIELAKNEELKRKLAHFMTPITKEAMSTPAAADPSEKKKDEPIRQELLQGWH